MILYSLGKSSFGMLGRIFGHSRSLIYRWIVEEMAMLPEPQISGDIKEMEFDEMWHFIGSKKNKIRIIKAVDRRTGRTVAWVTGGRDAATFRRLYDKVKQLKDCTFYTDDWDAFAKVLPAERHIIGKSGTVIIERDNSNTRHHLGRMTRRTKVVSKCPKMVDLSLRLYHHLHNGELFNTLAGIFRPILGVIRDKVNLEWFFVFRAGDSRCLGIVI